jgi:hypothetical protein
MRAYVCELSPTPFSSSTVIHFIRHEIPNKGVLTLYQRLNDVPMAVKTQLVGFWVKTLCSLVGINQCFRGTCSLHL